MAWMKVDQHLPSHRKTIALAKELGRDVTRFHAAGLLVAIWGWALDHAPDGRITPELHRDSIGKAIGSRSRDTDRTIAALRKIGWIDPDDRLHEWERWAGQLVEDRERDAQKARLRRQHMRGEHPSFIGDCPSCQRASERTREAERRADAAGPNRNGPSLRRPDVVPTSEGRGRQDKRETRQEPPTPDASRRREGTGSPDASGERQVRELLEATPAGRWRDALQALLLAGIPTHALASFFQGTHLEGSATVVFPTGFARDYVRDHYAVQVSEVLGELATFVTEKELEEQRAGAA